MACMARLAVRAQPGIAGNSFAIANRKKQPLSPVVASGAAAWRSCCDGGFCLLEMGAAGCGRLLRRFAPRNDAKTPSRNDAKTPSCNDAKTPSRNDAKIPSRNDAKTPSCNDAKTPSRNDAKTSSRNDAKASSRNDAKTPSRSDAKTSSRNDAKTGTHNGAQRGFTLMEMLVTLVLFGVLSSLLWQALGTLARLESRLAESRLFVSEEALYAEWVREALQGLMSGAQGDPLKMRGDAHSLRAYTSMPPWPGSAGPEAMELELSGKGASTTLAARRLAGQQDWPLWTWEGDGNFAYLDEDGRWQERWPPAFGKHPQLPVAVRLDGPPGGMVLVAVPAGDNPMLRRQDLERP